jgi:hypothetical protein
MEPSIITPSTPYLLFTAIKNIEKYLDEMVLYLQWLNPKG